MPTGVYARPDPIKRFWEKVEKTPGCWLWKGADDGNGYGSFKVNRRSYRAHRWIYEQLVGPLKPGEEVCHTCDNRACVKPDHLWKSNQTGNMDDMTNKGRRAQGSQVGTAKITEADVREIRSRYPLRRISGCDARALARRYGVHADTIRSIITRRTWQHIPSPQYPN